MAMWLLPASSNVTAKTTALILTEDEFLSKSHHRRRSQASLVLTAIGLVNGNLSFLTTHGIDVP